MRLMDILRPGCIKVPLKASTKQQAIFEMVDLLCDCVGIQARKELADAVWQRELTRTTGIGHGVAIPHGKCGGCSRLSMAIAKPAAPIDFASIDGKPVDLIILLASPPDQTGSHIEALATISRMLNDTGFHAAIKQAATSQDIFDLFIQRQAQCAR